MRCFDITFDQVIIRFYIMMAAVLIAGFSGYYLLALLALPIFLSTILGVSFHFTPGTEKKTSKQRPRLVAG